MLKYKMLATLVPWGIYAVCLWWLWPNWKLFLIMLLMMWAYFIERSLDHHFKKIAKLRKKTHSD